MAKLKDIMVYVINKYPNKYELSNARLTKIVYLADWKHAITYGTQISSINWYFDNYGPFVWDIKDTARTHQELFFTEDITNMYGSPKTIINLKNCEYVPAISEREMKSLDHVIEATKDLNWTQFIRLIYSTYPIIISEKYVYLDLIEKAKEYLKYSSGRT
jgi:hypothetical protein